MHQHLAACFDAGAQALIQKLLATFVGCTSIPQTVCCAGPPASTARSLLPAHVGCVCCADGAAPPRPYLQAAVCTGHACRSVKDAHNPGAAALSSSTAARPSCLSAVQNPVQAPIQKLLPPEVMLLIFSQLPIASTARAQCSCRQWYHLGLAPDLWRTACQETFQRCSYKRNSWLLRREYRCGAGVPCTPRYPAAAPCKPHNR